MSWPTVRRVINRGVAIVDRSLFIQVIKEWREEWDATPNQFLISEAFRQSDPEAYAEQVADHLLAKLIAKSGGAA
mgnify:CR=1 FL=1|jgi:hypothetical protein